MITKILMPSLLTVSLFVAFKHQIRMEANPLSGDTKPIKNILIAFRETINGEKLLGYRNQYGKVIIKPQFAEGGNFRDGYVEVRKPTKEGKAYKYNHRYDYFDAEDRLIIDESGEVIVEGKDRESFHCQSNGLLPKSVLPKYSKPGFHRFSETIPEMIDFKSGNLIPLPPEIAFIGCFENGIALVGLKPKVVNLNLETDGPGKWGYIGIDGKYKLEPIYDQAKDFDNGVALVKKDNQDFFINYQGKKVRPNTVELLGGQVFSEGLTIVESPLGTFKGVNIYGETIFKLPNNLECLILERDFADGRLPVKDKKTAKYGYVDRTGSLVIKTKFKSVGLFKNGIAEVVTSRNRKAYLNTAGEITWEEK
jgi:WG containing repeat